MQLVFANDHYQVVFYPELQAFELVNTRRGTGGFIAGEVARALFASMEGLMAKNPTEEDVEDVLEHFDALITQPLRYH